MSRASFFHSAATIFSEIFYEFISKIQIVLVAIRGNKVYFKINSIRCLLK